MTTLRFYRNLEVWRGQLPDGDTALFIIKHGHLSNTEARSLVSKSKLVETNAGDAQSILDSIGRRFKQ